LDITDRIRELKKQRNAVILAHYYQLPEIQDIADFVGDSFDLSRRAAATDADVIVFCSVRFMAESAKILNPSKTVLLPARDAGCPMADMAGAEDVLALKEQYPDAAAVCYVNTSAAVKAVCDICCTSSNAVKVVKSLPNKRIIFVPDENLGGFVAQQTPEKEIILFPGYCVTHRRVTARDVEEARAAAPGALVAVHPECAPEVVEKADFAGSTAQIIEYVNKAGCDSFIIGTEQGILHRLQKENPAKRFYLLSPKLLCPNMKKTTLNELLRSLEDMVCEIKLDADVMAAARRSLDRMIKIT